MATHPRADIAMGVGPGVAAKLSLRDLRDIRVALETSDSVDAKSTEVSGVYDLHERAGGDGYGEEDDFAGETLRAAHWRPRR